MTTMNAQMDPAKFSKMMQQFSMANEKMETASEMMDDLMDEVSIRNQHSDASSN